MPNEHIRLTHEDRYGLQEVADMNELVNRLDCIGEKEWFRAQMGISKGKHFFVLLLEWQKILRYRVDAGGI